VRAGLAAFLDFLAREPAFARMCIVEALAAGPDAVARRNSAMAAFADLVEENARVLGTPIEPQPITAETIVGGIYEVPASCGATSGSSPSCCPTSRTARSSPISGPSRRAPSGA
jgi:hypothetical protein